jgi:hypothetical protein
LRLSHTTPDDCGNVAAANPLPPYRGFRHQVQPRNRELATMVEIFWRTGNFYSLVVAGAVKSPGEQVMVIGYLIANDFAGAARDLEQEWGISLVNGLARLDRENGAELAEALGWARG